MKPNKKIQAVAPPKKRKTKPPTTWALMRGFKNLEAEVLALGIRLSSEIGATQEILRDSQWRGATSLEVRVNGLEAREHSRNSSPFKSVPVIRIPDPPVGVSGE